jgi:ATP-binding cassette subfamily B protein
MWTRKEYLLTSSPEALPHALPSMWRLCKLGFRHEPRLLGIAFVLTLLAAVPDALLALWLSLLLRAVVHSEDTLLIVSAIGLGASGAATWFLTTVSTRLQRRFRDKITIVLESHVARLQATIGTIAHQERPDYLDRLAVLRDQVFVLDHMYMSVFTTASWILRLTITIGLLMSISPRLGLLAFFALPTVATSLWRPGVERAVQEKVAQPARLARHLFVTMTGASPGKEVRLWRIGNDLIRRRQAEWAKWHFPIARSRWVTAIWNTVAWTVFGVAYVGAIVYVAEVHKAGVAGVVLVLAAGSRLSGYLAATVGEIGFLRGIWMDGSIRLAWLENYAAAVAAAADQSVPERIHDGIRFANVSFAYPGTERVVLKDIDLTLPAGSVIAIVGENGAGKTTLVKLIAKMYEPSAGRILVDGRDLSRMAAEDWRSRMAGAFQDFFKFELIVQESIGVGDIPRIDEKPAVLTAVGRAGADDVLERMSLGLGTQLGPTWPGGMDLSFGQWQKLALARGFMRDQPLLLILDEPTAALDAETEHALFERYAGAARQGLDNSGGITILISHRFSTVRMADIIVVLDGSRVAEVGSHDDLMYRQGQYAELYNMQAASYR